MLKAAARMQAMHYTTATQGDAMRKFSKRKICSWYAVVSSGGRGGCCKGVRREGAAAAAAAPGGLISTERGGTTSRIGTVVRDVQLCSG